MCQMFQDVMICIVIWFVPVGIDIDGNSMPLFSNKSAN